MDRQNGYGFDKMIVCIETVILCKGVAVFILHDRPLMPQPVDRTRRESLQPSMR